jgi:2'-5' RNA ligase
MTLLFLGMVDRERLAQLMNVADSIAARSFSVSLQRFSCWRHNRIGYVAPIAEVEALDALVMALRHAVAQAGFDFDHKAFKPHVTLLRNVRHMIESCDVPETIWRVDQFALVASVTTDQRARYEVIRSWALSGAVVSG